MGIIIPIFNKEATIETAYQRLRNLLSVKQFYSDFCKITQNTTLTLYSYTEGMILIKLSDINNA